MVFLLFYLQKIVVAHKKPAPSTPPIVINMQQLVTPMFDGERLDQIVLVDLALYMRRNFPINCHCRSIQIPHHCSYSSMKAQHRLPIEVRPAIDRNDHSTCAPNATKLAIEFA